MGGCVGDIGKDNWQAGFTSDSISRRQEEGREAGAKTAGTKGIKECGGSIAGARQAIGGRM
jgi:hypothetical protein